MKRYDVRQHVEPDANDSFRPKYVFSFKATEIMDAKPMNLVRCVAVYVLLLPAVTSAQQVWDKLDVVDGPDPTLRYGFYTEPTGEVRMGRYYFVDDGVELRVRLAPYGRTAVELPVHGYDRDDGVLELGWEGRPDRTCRLKRENETLLLGNCIQKLVVMPIAIRVADERDAEWMGTYFSVSNTDIAILDRARQILREQGRRNPNGDRNCDDDVATGQFSIFCALYYASVEVAGVYRHRRPAMRAVRDDLRRRYPGQYAHTLRDINNNSAIPDESFIEAVDSARTRLVSELDAQR